MRGIRGLGGLPLVVLLVATLGTTLVATLALLLTVTEERGVRTALAAADPADAQVLLRFEDLRADVGVDLVRDAVAPAVGALTGTEVSVAGTVRSADLALVEDGRTRAVTWLGTADGIAGRVRLVAGTWPGDATDVPAGAVPVAVPDAASPELDPLDVGDTVRLVEVDRRTETTVHVVGRYRVLDPTDPVWGPRDLGAPEDEAAAATGPLLTTEAGVTADGVTVAALSLRVTPDLSGVGVADLGPLTDRLARAEAVVLPRIGDVSRATSLVVGLDRVVAGVTTPLVTTRSTLLVGGTLVVVLAVTALLGAARLLVDARAGRLTLLRARGASERQLLARAAAEATAIAVAAALLGPLLARALFRGLSASGDLAGAGPAADPGTPAVAWAVAAAVGLLVALALVSPFLRGADTFVETEQARARPGARAVVARSGADLAVVGLAAVAAWQMTRRPGTASAPGVGLDPLLVAGPALVLLAGALLAARALRPLGRTGELLAARGRGLVAPLAAWQVGRGTGRSTSAVLLLCLALAGGTFGLSVLATWERSQDDQAAWAVGAPVRLVDEVLQEPLRASDAAAPGGGDPQPALRTEGRLSQLTQQGYGAPWALQRSGVDAEVLALTADARAMLDRGRLAGLVPAAAGPEPVAAGLPLPAGATRLLATVLTSSTAPTNDVVVPTTIGVRLVLEDPASGVLTTVVMGDVVDHGTPTSLEAEVPRAAGAGALRLVAVQASVTADPAGLGAVDPRPGPQHVTLDLTSVATATGDAEAVPLDLTGAASWSATREGMTPAEGPPAPGLSAAVDPDRLAWGPATTTVHAWEPVSAVPATCTAGLAERVGAAPGRTVHLLLLGSYVPLECASTTPRVPTTLERDVVVPDHAALARALVQNGSTASGVDEWWVDVAPDDVPVYLGALGRDATGLPVADRALAETVTADAARHHPLRLAVRSGLVLVAVAAAALAAIGFVAHGVVAVRERSGELARLRATGLQRRELVALLGLETLLLGALGVGLGVALGVGLTHLAAALFSATPDGRAPVPAVLTVTPGAQVGVLTAATLGVVVAVMVGLGSRQATADPANVLRAGDAR